LSYHHHHDHYHHDNDQIVRYKICFSYGYVK
jgi:hypothetical protein